MLLVGRQEGHPAWRGYLSGARCRLHMAQLMPLPLTVSCFSEIQIGFTFLVLAYPGSPGKRAVKRVCVLVHGINAAKTIRQDLSTWTPLHTHTPAKS